MRNSLRKVMKCGVSVSLLCLVLTLIRPGVCEGIEKVSYLLQYGPGVHTVFEQEHLPDKPKVVMKDRVAPSPTPSTLTSKTTTNSGSPNASESSTTGLLESTRVTHIPSSIGTVPLHSFTAVTESVPLTTVTVTPVLVERSSTDKNDDDISTVIPTHAPPETSKRNITSDEHQRPADGGSMAPDDRRCNHVSGACRTSASVLQKLHPLPLPPPLPSFGAILRSDVMVNLKPKELRTLMSTYIALIEAYKSFNQQQKRNIAYLEEELARGRSSLGRANSG
uniref:Uncharacterized protein n=1 Tax=Anopheles culicifacies TaxID=139723 RepID=A0A182M1J8_9DIPT